VTAAAYSGPASLGAVVLPARAAYIIRAGSRSGFRRAIQEASTRWGGMCEPVIPVRRGGAVDRWWRQTVETAGVAAAVNIDVPPEDAQNAGAALSLPVVDLADIDRAGPARFTVHPSALPVKTESVPVLPAAGADLWLATAAGDITAEHEAGWAEARGEFRREPLPDQVARYQLWQQTLIDRTVDAFGEYLGANTAGSIPAIVWITTPNDLVDCLQFWNLRSLRSLTFSPGPMVLLPHNEVQHWLGFDRQLHDALKRPDEFSPDVLIYSMHATREVMDRIAGELGLVATAEEDIRSGHRWPAEQRSAPFTYATSDRFDPRQWFVGRRRYGELTEFEAHFHAGQATLRFASPVAWTPPGGSTLLQFRGPVLEALPKKPVVAGMVITAGEWRNDMVQIATNAQGRFLLELKLPTLREALEAILRAQTIGHGLSDKGRLGTALIDKAADLLLPGVYEAAISLTTPRSRQLVRELQALVEQGDLDERAVELAARWGGRTQRRYRNAANLGRPSGQQAATALEHLCAMGWAERGLEVACSNCGMTSFVPITEATADAACPGCGTGQRYSGIATGPTVQYRLNTLVDRAADQGVLPHLLVAAVLKQRDERTLILPGVDVEFAPNQTPELDLIGIHAGKLIAGEVKTNPVEFDDRQIERDLTWSAMVQADVHVMAAVGDVPARAVAKAEAEAKERRLELMILTGSELRP
jgi:hypothetical protein